VSTAFVLGGGGLMGSHEVGMLRALAEGGIRPDLVVGTSVGALNGVVVAADPSDSAGRLAEMWQGEPLRLAFSETLVGRAARLARSGTHLYSMEPLRRLISQLLPGPDFEDLELPFQCVAANIEGASARWFSKGPVVPAVIASCAVPGLLPAAEIDGEHYFDGGLVDSIPVGRAVALGATTVYVLHAGRIESPLTEPHKPWQVALVAFEIARRHRFHEEMAALPEGVRVHVLPTGGDHLPPGWSQFRYRDKKRVKLSIERAYAAFADYLAKLGAAERVCGLEVTVSGPLTDGATVRGRRPVIVLSRHAGPGDSLLLVHQLLNVYQRRPRIVMKAALQLDPGLDVVANRLPNVFVGRRSGSGVFADAISRLARGLSACDALVIFPEGGNWTPARWRRGIRRLRRSGSAKLAARAEAMPHLLPPRPGGVLAAIAACPEADVVFVAHTGLDHLVSAGDVWRHLPSGISVSARWWLVPACEVPRDAGREAQVGWLYDWWETMDAWIATSRDTSRALTAG
jgi:NTE family protein